MFNVVTPLVANATTLAQAAVLVNKNLWDLWRPSVPWTWHPPVNGPVPIQVTDSGFSRVSRMVAARPCDFQCKLHNFQRREGGL